MVLAVGAVHHHLIRQGTRLHVGLVVESGEPREIHHFAVLFGYGAGAINPYLAFETLDDMIRQGMLPGLDHKTAVKNYIKALNKGVLKVISKMGISTIQSYRGAQIFEAIGLDKAFVDRYFTWTASRIAGVGLDVVAEEALRRHHRAFPERPTGEPELDWGGEYQWRRDGEYHLFNPDTVFKLQHATRSGQYAIFKEYTAAVNDQSRHLATLRGLFDFTWAHAAIPLDEVEPVESIVRRFATGAMSYGSISQEAHETIAIAMNRMHAMSNSGEGGEDPARYRPLENGDNLCSAIKQVASGRFGVTTDYLVNAKDLQIKVAQGANPGEGGQLPGHKVNREIARVRHSTPGVTLISPPPHHDIYSIEDLAQLIHDLKNVNPSARISVKLVSESGVGTVAAGVAKARADVILVSGGDGGTGAAPLSSIKYAGMPWELGLAEAQQTLVLNQLRDRVRLQVDGQIRTGRDVMIAALLGAEEFGFATAPLVVCGCVMMRKCHANTCPVGVATQNPELRKRFSGKPEYLISFFRMIAREVRELMADLGFKTLDEAIGRADLLETAGMMKLRKAANIDCSAILHNPGKWSPLNRRKDKSGEDQLKDALDKNLIGPAESALKEKKPFNIELPVRNINRSVGAMLAGHLARNFGPDGISADMVNLNFTGSAGQSFGAFAVKGMKLVLTGEANDYLGKGLSGGKIIVKPPEKINFKPEDNIIAGNTILYGATSGEAFICGRVGERFAVRNSGALAVVEGVGDHGCEYMTGGRVVVLGETGINFAAGMSGGLAYVYDDHRNFDIRCNLDMVDLESMEHPDDIAELRGLIEKHMENTGSAKARYLLAHWEACLPYFVKVFPMEYRRVLGQMSREDEATQRQELIHG